MKRKPKILAGKVPRASELKHGNLPSIFGSRLMNPNKKKHAPGLGKHSSKPARPAAARALKGISTPRFWLLLFVGGAVLGLVAFISIRHYRQPTHNKDQASPRPSATATSLTQTMAAAAATNAASRSGTNEVRHEEGESTLSGTEIAVGLLNQGNELLAQGKPDEAVKEYEHSLRHDPGSEDTHYNLAIALAKLGRDEEAVQHYKEALRILPDYAEAHNNLGNVLVKRGNFAEAVEHFNEALNLNPDSASTQNNLGTALARQGKLTDATIHFAKAVQLMPAYLDAHYNLGNAYVAQGRVDEAIEEFQEALRLQPDFAPALRALGKARQKKSR